MKKDIYIIKNKINNKCYIGQSVDAAQRFKSHCKPSSTKNNISLIEYAIQKYGKENFYYEILEHNIENYNEMECYWIEKLNTRVPFGYNIARGGENPPINRDIDSINTKFHSEQDVLNIKKDLANTTMSLNEIAKKYGISKRCVLRINQGVTYKSELDSIPIRKAPNSSNKLSYDDAKSIIDILKNTYRHYEDIANEYHISISEIKNINGGYSYRMQNETYPIRKYKNCGTCPLTPEQVKDIINDIKFSKLSLRSISKKYNVNKSLIFGICNGSVKRFRQDNEVYPLRKY